MKTDFTKLIDPLFSDPFESEVNLVLCDLSHGQLSSFSGTITGPHCKFARTLPSTFHIPECECLPDISHMTQKRITDPCYWSPALPYLYEFTIEMKLSDGSAEIARHTIGFRRWEVDGRNLLLERKRIVLRGVVADSGNSIDLSEARDAEMCVVVADPSEAFLQQASELGIMLVVDLRGCESDPTHRLLSLAWQPCVAFSLAEWDASYIPHTQILSDIVSSATDFSPKICNNDQVGTIVVDLHENERPPSFLSNIDKPVIAIRRGVEFVNLHEARTACDRLQAELAPEFDLAGYFVAP